MSSNYRSPLSLRALGLGLVAAAAPLPAMAQQAQPAARAEVQPAVPADELDPIEVRAERLNEHPYADPDAPYRTVNSASPLLTEPLQETPKSVQVLSAEYIDDLGAGGLREIMTIQPGVTLGTGEGGNAFGDRFFIRGFDVRNDIYVDGVRDPGVSIRDSFGVEQIEILRGPSSAFAGRGTTGGAVSLITKQPAPVDFGDLEVVVGTDNLVRTTLDVSRHIGDTLAVRFNGLYQDSNTPGRNAVYNNRWGWAFAAEWSPIQDLRLGVDYYYLETDYMPDWGVPYDVANNRPFDVNRENFYGITQRDFGRSYVDVYTLTGDWRIGDDLSLHSIIRYGDTGNAYTASAPEQPNVALGTVGANAKRRNAITEYLVNQTQLTWHPVWGGMQHTIVGGYEVSGERILNRQGSFTECATDPCTGATGNPRQSLYNPNPYRPWATLDNGIVSRNRIEVASRAVYVLDTVHLNDQWRLLGGLRWDNYDVELRNVTVATGALTARESSSSFLNWHLGAVYLPRPNISLYANVASSSNPSGEQLDSTGLDYGGLDARIVGLEPERNIAWELGAKTTLFGGHLDVTGAIFQIDKTDARTVVGSGPTAIVTNDGEQRVRGVEILVAGNITDQWSVFGGITLLDTEVLASGQPTQVGQPFPNVSETSFTLTSRYQVNDRLNVGGTAIYNSERFGGTITAGTTQLPDYWRFDLFGGYQLTETVEVSFNVLNLTDEVYYDALYRSGTPFTYIAPGRSVQVRIDYDF